MLRRDNLLRRSVRRSHRIVLARHSTEDDLQFCRESQQCAVKSKAANLAKGRSRAWNTSMGGSSEMIFAGKNA
jgi:hypothetical protein